MSSGKKESPRQKMIGMMYLVLTAMLALNVSKEVLEGYSVVNSSVEMTNTSLSSKRDDAYTKLQRDYAMNQIEVGPYMEKSNTARKLSAEMIDFIGNLRNELISATEGIPVDSAKNISVANLKTKDNYTIPTNFLLGVRINAPETRAAELKSKIVEYRRSMIDLIHPKNRGNLKIGLETEGDYYNTSGQLQSWENYYFYDIPLAADVPILNKFITEVINAELEVIDELLYEISADDYRYDQVAARILPKTNFLFTGDMYEAEVVVAAFDTTRTPSVYLMQGVDSLPVSMKDKATLITGTNGQIRFNFPANRTGAEKYAGFVSVHNNSGSENTYHFNSEYFVASPSISISATSMNVLYIGVNNPLTIAVSGIANDNIFPTISCGSLTPDKSTGGWIAKVPIDCKQARIEVSATINGARKNMGFETFRVKKLPDPMAYIAGVKEGFVNRESLILSGKIIPLMPSDFEFEYSFDIQSFKMTMQRGFTDYQFESKSNNLTDEMKAELKKTNRGQVIVFDEIIARGPDGANRALAPMYISIK